MLVHYRFRVVSSNRYQVHQKGGAAFEGDATEIIKKALELGMSQKYLIVAVNELHKCEHEYADFDRAGTLMYTRKEKW